MNYQYRNRRTGAVIDVPCHLEGPDWEDLTVAAKPEAAPAKNPDAEKAPAKKPAVKPATKQKTRKAAD